MVEILVFDTIKESEKRLEQCFYRNKLVAQEIFNERKTREIAYRNSSAFKKYHGSKDNAKLTSKEAGELKKLSGKGRIFTPTIKLFGVRTDFYAFREAYTLDTRETIKPFGTPTVMAEELHKDLEIRTKELWGARLTPFLYTVQEPLLWSEEEKKHLRKTRGYNKLNKAAQKLFNQELENYVERGLIDDERQEFVRRYVQFLN